MKRSDDIQILKQSLKRNRVRIIVWVLAIIAGLAIGGYAGVFDKLYVFYCVVSGNLLHTFYFRSGKKCCCTVICGHGNFYWIVSSWFGKNGFERERGFMIQILYFRNNNKILFFPRLL